MPAEVMLIIHSASKDGEGKPPLSRKLEASKAGDTAPKRKSAWGRLGGRKSSSLGLAKSLFFPSTHKSAQILQPQRRTYFDRLTQSLPTARRPPTGCPQHTRRTSPGIPMTSTSGRRVWGRIWARGMLLTQAIRSKSSSPKTISAALLQRSRHLLVFSPNIENCT